MKRLVYFFVLVCGIHFNGNASHIVGGDFYYDDLGNDEYKITLKLYIDCINGNKQAIASDFEAIIGVFDAATNDFISMFNVARLNPELLNKLHYKCVRPPTDVCVHGYEYTKVIKLDPGKNGKILAFQRCCRNNSISNIVSPESTGSTYWIKIPPRSTVPTNSAPRFKELPPNYLCTDAPLVFDHSATDPDGDSLVYEFFQPYLGATKDDPRPNNTFDNGYLKEPPFNIIQWRSPYHTYNQMAGDPKLTIDRFTGEIRVIPNITGQFVIGIKVLEYRNGELIGETYRDYQFNVRRCEFDIISAFTAPVYSCSDTVNFINKSYKAAGYHWDFGDPFTQADTSNEMNPTYVYPRDGNYRVTLRAWNEICEDTYITTVKIRNNIQVGLGPDLVFCKSVDRFLNTKAFDATRVIWNTGQSGPVIRAKDTGTYSVTVYYDQCFASDTIHLGMNPVEFSLPSDSLFCEEVDMLIDAGVSGYSFRWSPSFRDTFRTLQVYDTGWYWVRVSNKDCYKVDSIYLYTPNKPKIGPYYFVCNEFIKTLDGGGRPGATYKWQDGSTDRFYTISQKGTYYVETKEGHCVASDTLVVDNPVIKLELGENEHFCDEVSKLLIAPPYMQLYQWQNETGGETFQASRAGKYFVYVLDTNGCSKTDTVEFFMTTSPEISLGSDTSICSRTELELSPGEGFDQYIWSAGEGDNTSKLVIENAGTYFVTVVDSYGCTAVASVNVTVDPNALPNDLYIPNAFTPNDDGLNEVFPFAFEVVQSDYRVRVFSRWGEKVFDSSTDGLTWDAKYKGKLPEPDAYLYLVEYRGCDGMYRRIKGTVSVLR